MYEDWSDKALVKAWADGNQQAGSALVHRHIDTLYRFFAARGALDIAPDLVQRCFLDCVEARQRLSEVNNLKAYLLTIARRRYIDHLRKQERQKRALDRATEDPLLLPTPGKHIALREEQRLLLRALGRLPEPLQLIVQLYYWEDLNTGEIADIAGLQRGTVMSRLHRARSLLAAEIEKLSQSSLLASTTISSFESWMRSIAEVSDR